MGKLPISVVILTLNAEHHLPDLLDSILPYVEDVFIVDSRSTDRTVDIALERSVKIVQRAFTTPPDQYGWAFRNLPIKTEWLFSLDQDERFSHSLIDELRELFGKDIDTDIDGFTVKWRLWFMGRPLHATTDTFRLMRVSKCHVTEVSCNEHFVVPGRVERLNGLLEHKDVLNLHEWYEKQNLWTTLEAIGRIRDSSDDERGRLFGTQLQRKMFFKRLFIHSPGGKAVMFLYYYVWYGAWRDGYAGFCWARLRVWVHNVGDMKEKEFRRIGIPDVLPAARHGGYDKRILASDLQQLLLPETCCSSAGQ